MISDDGIEILLDTDVLGVGGVIPGEPWGFQECSRALGSAIGFTDVRVLAVFILYHGRPVDTDYGSHQLGEILPPGPVRECTPLSNPPQGKVASHFQRHGLA